MTGGMDAGGGTLGTPSGGTSNAGSGGSGPLSGGTTANGSGGSDEAGSGGASMGGAQSTFTGGSSVGSTGGAGTSGSGSGGVATGGVETGGSESGGLKGFDTGGAETGGAATGGESTGGQTGGDPPTGTMRVFYLRPTDVASDQRYPDGIGNVMLEAQAFFKEKLGKTFRLNDPIVETIVGEHERSWYENTANGGDKYWWSAANAQQEIARRLNLSIPDPRWMVVSEVSAEGDGAGGGATGGWVLLCGHDADGGAGYPADTARWVGGMVHELGHAFGLPDSTSTDGTCLSASFYDWPDCTFTQSQKDDMLNGNWGSGKFLF
jgi:hypothetical protein